MSRPLVVLALVLAASCGGATGAAVPTAAPSASASAAPSAADPSRVEGTVTAVTATKLTLTGNTTLDITPTTRVIRTDRATAADLKPGAVVAVTAKQQADDTLLASMVNIFPASLAATIAAGQRPLPDGNLMTNAPIVSIDQVTASSFTVTFSGGTAKVVLASTAVITKQTDVKPEDVAVGAHVVALLRGGAVQSVQIQGN